VARLFDPLNQSRGRPRWSRAAFHSRQAPACAQPADPLPSSGGVAVRRLASVHAPIFDSECRPGDACRDYLPDPWWGLGHLSRLRGQRNRLIWTWGGHYSLPVDDWCDTGRTGNRAAARRLHPPRSCVDGEFSVFLHRSALC
jgi:hypothetical protein